MHSKHLTVNPIDKRYAQWRTNHTHRRDKTSLLTSMLTSLLLVKTVKMSNTSSKNVILAKHRKVLFKTRAYAIHSQFPTPFKIDHRSLCSQSSTKHTVEWIHSWWLSIDSLNDLFVAYKKCSTPSLSQRYSFMKLYTFTISLATIHMMLKFISW